MKKRYSPFFFLILFIGCQQKQTDTAQLSTDSLVNEAAIIQSASETAVPATLNFLIIPGIQAGPVSASSTEASLIALLGAQNVVRDTIYVAEGDFDIGTTLYKNTANQAQILWTDKRRFARPETVLIRPARDEDNKLIPGPSPQWITDKGLTLGTSLQSVEKINGRAFSLYGFGWDYGGLSSGWKGGALEQKGGKTYIGLSFGMPETMSAAQEKNYDSLQGDQEFMSNHPAMHTLNPTVQNLTISFK
ncbi:hypothetical protein [uncultured Fibrella sp.]|uniref:hypothetical protein n=1 Tax=uncultured Fibrella sp. TaxID=1284596 RepID=UPI0035CB4A4A